MENKIKHLVCGAGGFIFGEMVKQIKKRDENAEIIALDIKPYHEWFQKFDFAKNIAMDLEDREPIRYLIEDFKPDYIWQGACNMGGMGFLELNQTISGFSVRMNSNLIEAVIKAKIKPHIFYSSSACVYNQDLQSTGDDIYLKESDAIPANPDLQYGWQKLHDEFLFQHLNKEFNIPISIVRFHNVYGPHGTFEGGKEKAPAAAIRKMIEFKHGKTVSVKIWGDGNAKRSFMYIDGCIEGIFKIVENGYNKPINLGSSEGVTIQQLHNIAANCVGVTPVYEYDLSAPQGVKSRNSDNTLIKQILNWEPQMSLIKGMIKTSKWIEEQYE